MARQLQHRAAAQLAGRSYAGPIGHALGGLAGCRQLALMKVVNPRASHCPIADFGGRSLELTFYGTRTLRFYQRPRRALVKSTPTPVEVTE